MDFETFARYAQSGNLIPVFRERLADLETPVSVLSRFAADDNVFLLESVEGNERFGRYSFIGISPRRVFTVENHQAFLTGPEGKTALPGGFFALRELMRKVKAVPVPGLPPLFGGAIGFLGYEIVNAFEQLPPPKTALSAPEAVMLLTDCGCLSRWV